MDINELNNLEAAEADATTIVYYTEVPTVGQQVVSSLIAVAVPLVAGFGFLGAVALVQYGIQQVRTRRAAKNASPD